MLGMRSFSSAHLVCEKLVGAHLEPALAAVACALFQHGVQKQYVLLCKGTFGIVDDPVDAAKVVGRLDYVVQPENRAAFFASNGICLVHEGRLLVREATPFYAVGMVGEVHLHAMVDAAGQAHLPFFRKPLQKGAGCALSALWSLCAA